MYSLTNNYKAKRTRMFFYLNTKSQKIQKCLCSAARCFVALLHLIVRPYCSLFVFPPQHYYVATSQWKWRTINPQQLLCHHQSSPKIQYFTTTYLFVQSSKVKKNLFITSWPFVIMHNPKQYMKSHGKWHHHLLRRMIIDDAVPKSFSFLVPVQNWRKRKGFQCILLS